MEKKVAHSALNDHNLFAKKENKPLVQILSRRDKIDVIKNLGLVVVAPP